MLRALALVVGVLLLLPGACSLGFMVLFIGAGNSGGLGPLPLLWLACFAISFGGILMIRSALRRIREDKARGGGPAAET